MPKYEILQGDCLEQMQVLIDAGIQVHSVVTDPPYHLQSIVSRFGKPNSAPTVDKGVFRRSSKGFMGKEWDGGDIAFNPDTWRYMYRLLYPGGHLLAFAATKNYHRMACAIEDAGFEIRDQIGWLYGTGMPKSHDIAMHIDKIHGVKRKIIGYTTDNSPIYDKTLVTEDAKKWEGWGTGLKPAWEPICFARKPLEENSIARNVLKQGTGAININNCKIATSIDTSIGRWPANVIHDGSDEVEKEFAKYGIKTSGKMKHLVESYSGENVTTFLRGKSGPHNQYGDTGTPARFFYSAKATPKERAGSKHPTVKPLNLMRYLVRLVTPKNGLVLDPFAGTGTTLAAAFLEECDSIGIEKDNEYIKDIHNRMNELTEGILDV